MQSDLTSPASPSEAPGATAGPRPIEIALLISVFVVAACGLLYELAAGALASYVLGDSVLQFSTIIGTYLFAMGVGSWLSRYFERQLPAHFLRIELLVALIGGALPATLFLANAYTPGAFRFLLYGMVLMVGTLVGLEIPLVMRILKRNVALKDLVSQVLTFDYLGALAVSMAFPLLLVPHLGLIRTGLLFGVMNAAVALWAVWLFRHELRRLKAHLAACVMVLGILLAALAVPLSRAPGADPAGWPRWAARAAILPKMAGLPALAHQAARGPGRAGGRHLRHPQPLAPRRGARRRPAARAPVAAPGGAGPAWARRARRAPPPAAAAARRSTPRWRASRRCTTRCRWACCRARRVLPTLPRPAAPTWC